MANTLRKTTPVKLSLAGLPHLPAKVARPAYERSDLKPGIIHVGVGNFHRAHQAWYLHRLMQHGGNALNWAIIGAGVRPYDAAMREKLLAQDCLTTLIELDPASTSAEVIGPMLDYLPVEEHNGALIQAMARPEIRIVSLTVTEGGYYVDASAGGFDVSHPDIVHDANKPDRPITVFGAIAAALKLRRDAGLGAFAVQSCDNLQGNGRITRNAVVTLARMADPSLADWIDENASFPSSMVDCIVPATGPAEIAMARDLGIDDAVPVTHENFRQWVIEDDFCAGRPEWEKVGVTLTDDVHDFETMKIRILNAGHQVVAAAGELLSVQAIAECMAHPLIAALFRKVEMEEIAPYVRPIPGMTPEEYVDLISRRFSNPLIHDTTRRVAFDGSSRHTGFVHPVLRDALAAGGSIEGLSLAEALWARMCAGFREDGSQIEPNDPYWDSLVAAALAARERPRAWLEQRNIYGDLAGNRRFANAFETWLAMIWEEGTEAAISRYCRDK